MAKKTADTNPKANAKAKPEKAKPEKANVSKDTKNGVTRPKAGTATGKVWEHSDRITASAKRTAARAEVMEAAKKDGVNDATIATQYGKWRRYNGITGRVTAE